MFLDHILQNWWKLFNSAHWWFSRRISMVVYPLHDFLKPIQVMDPVEVGDVETKNSVNSLQMANAAAASLQNAFLQSARPLPFSINNILHQVRHMYIFWFFKAALDIHLETVQDFLIKLGIKPLMHLFEISIFSLNDDLRRTKIMNNLVKDLKILSFKVIFQCLKLVESF